jgi:hypothetical protein
MLGDIYRALRIAALKQHHQEISPYFGGRSYDVMKLEWKKGMGKVHAKRCCMDLAMLVLRRVFAASGVV